MKPRAVPLGSMGRRLLRPLTALAVSWVFALPAHGATILFNTTVDAIAIDGMCTLREAVIAANTNTGAGTPREGECPAGDPAPSVDIILFADLPGSPDVFALSIPGTGGFGEQDATKGDLDITEAVHLSGTLTSRRRRRLSTPTRLIGSSRSIPA